MTILAAVHANVSAAGSRSPGRPNEEALSRPDMLLRNVSICGLPKAFLQTLSEAAAANPIKTTY